MVIKTAADAGAYLERHISESGLIQNPANYRKHSYDTGKIARGRAVAIRVYNTEFNVGPEEIEAAGILHDLGKCFTEDFLHETILTGEYLEREGMPRIARAVRTHFTIGETLEIERRDGTPYRDFNPEEFFPKTWNEILVAYGDLHSDGKRIMTFEERMEDIFSRHGEKKVFVESMHMAMDRLRKIRDDVDALASAANPELMLKYGFI